MKFQPTLRQRQEMFIAADQEPPMLRVLIADDHEVVRRGVRDIVETHPGWEVCGEAGDGEKALALALSAQPDVVVLDVSMPTMNGLIVTRRLRQEAPRTSVLLFTMHEESEAISNGLAAGARGYLLKTDSATHLEPAIASLAVQRPYFSPAVTERLLDAAVTERKPSRLESFTVRELEVAQLIAEGYTNKLIARHLSRSLKTIESHRAAIMRKAEAHSTGEFVRFAIRHGMIQA